MKTAITSVIAALEALAVVSAPLMGLFTTDAQANEPSNVQCQTIRADLEWQSTGISANQDNFVCVSARGLWSHGIQGIQDITPYYGPRGFAKDDPVNVPEVVSRVGALIARIGGNAPFVVEDLLCFIPTTSGELILSMNDSPGAFGDNQGVMKVRIEKLPLSSVSPEELSSTKFMKELNNENDTCFK